MQTETTRVAFETAELNEEIDDSVRNRKRDFSDQFSTGTYNGSFKGNNKKYKVFVLPKDIQSAGKYVEC